jgi:nicotinate phosphoribosyltransferase
VDTYDTLGSGVPNFICVALALVKLGYKPAGIRLDSGDLAFLSIEARRMFDEVAARYSVDFSELKIVASNDINEGVVHALNQ